MKESDIRKLQERYEKMLEDGTSSYFEPDEFALIADLYEQEMSYRKALQVISRGLDTYPGNEQLLLQKSSCLLSLGRIEDAAGTLTYIAERNLEYYFILSEIELMRDNRQAAFEAFMQIVGSSECTIEDCIDILDVCANNDHVALLEQITPIIEQTFTDASPYLRELAMLYDELENDEQAIASYNKVLDINPYSTDDWFSLSKIYARRKEYDKAIEACDFALAIDENDENIIAFKGYCHYDNEEYDKAVELFKLFLQHTSDKSVAYQLIAEAYGRMENHEGAIENLLKAMELNDHSHDIYYQLGVNYYYTGDSESAVKYLYKAVECDDNDNEAHILLGELLLHKKEYAEAYKHLQRVEINPVSDTISATALSDACIQMQYYDQAIEILKQLIEQEPYEPHYLFDIILCHFQLNNYETAAQWVAQAEQIANDTSIIETLDASTQKAWRSIKKRIDEMRNILRIYLDEEL